MFSIIFTKYIKKDCKICTLRMWHNAGYVAMVSADSPQQGVPSEFSAWYEKFDTQNEA